MPTEPAANGVKRREFLKILGAGGATAATAACGPSEVGKLIPYLVSADDSVPGVSTYYATTCRECAMSCGVLAEVRDGRTFKLEGNPLHPVSRGAICSRGLAAVQGLYNPDRIKRPLVRRNGELVPISWDEALTMLAERLGALRAAGTASRAVFINHGEQGAFASFLDEWLQAHGMPPHLAYDPLYDAAIARAHREAYGVSWPGIDFERARLIVSFGADFLEHWGPSIPLQLGYANARAKLVDAPRHVYVGGRRSLTGLNADSWLAARPGSELVIAQALLAALGGGAPARLAQAAESADVPVVELQRLADELRSARPSVILAGGATSNTSELAAVVGALNRALGNIGVTILPDRSVATLESAATFADLMDVTRRMGAGDVPIAMVRGANPVFTLPPAAGFAEALDRVPFKVSFSSYSDETTVRCDLVLPDHHPLEQWDMIPAVPGVISMQQPAMDPVFDTRATADVLLDVARRDPALATQFAEPGFREWLVERFPGGVEQFTTALADGITSGALPGAPPSAPRAIPREPASMPIERTAGDFFLVVYPHAFLGDGRGANKPWLQEIPDPVTKVSWQTTVEIHPSTARRMGVAPGDLLEVTTKAGSITAAAVLYPGVRADTVAIATGRGHTAYGRYAEGVGVSPLALLPMVADQRSGALALTSTRARVRRTGEQARLVTTEGSARQHGRGIARAILVSDVPGRPEVAVTAQPGAEHVDEIAPGIGGVFGGQRRPDEAREQLQHAPERDEHLFMGEAPREFQPGLRAPAANDAEGAFGDRNAHRLGSYLPEHWSKMASRRWAMAIDLARCTGCSDCITACYSENNIPTVGAKWQAPGFVAGGDWGSNVVKGREMTWIRLERYYEGGERMGEQFEPDFETRFVPMLCQHCGNAPCEPVCPVYATYHSPDGLNVQVYNRCVGTRYCSNNCPYKVRYFNWFGYGEPNRPQYSWPEPLNWLLNPDVTVRGKGVMEKCTFCVQRIREAENRAAAEGRRLEADEFTTACAQACPSRAIVFGDASDLEWSVNEWVRNPRSYHVFEELKTYTAVVYLKKVNHPAPTALAGE